MLYSVLHLLKTDIQIFVNLTRSLRRLRRINYDNDFEKIENPSELVNIIPKKYTSQELKNKNNNETFSINNQTNPKSKTFKEKLKYNGSPSPIRYQEEIDDTPDYNLRYDRYNDKNTKYNNSTKNRSHSPFFNDNNFSKSKFQEEKEWKSTKPHHGGGFHDSRNGQHNVYKNTQTSFINEKKGYPRDNYQKNKEWNSKKSNSDPGFYNDRNHQYNDHNNIHAPYINEKRKFQNNYSKDNYREKKEWGKNQQYIDAPRLDYNKNTKDKTTYKPQNQEKSFSRRGSFYENTTNESHHRFKQPLQDYHKKHETRNDFDERETFENLEWRSSDRSKTKTPRDNYQDNQINRPNENIDKYAETTKFSSNKTPHKFKKALETRTLGKGLSPPKNNVDNMVITEPLKPKQKLHLDTVTSGENEFCVRIKRKDIDVQDITLEELELSESIYSFLKLSNVEKLSPIQSTCFFPIKLRKNMLICSQTGTGKTLAYLLPLLVEIVEKDVKFKPEDVEPTIPDDSGSSYFSKIPTNHLNISNLIIVPNNSLVCQIMKTLDIACKTIGIRSCNLMSMSDMLDKPNANFYVSTPGRFFDLVDNDKTVLESMNRIVIDEADMILQEHDRILTFLDNNMFTNKRKTNIVLVSSTLPMIDILDKFQNNFGIMSIYKLENHKLVSHVQYKFAKVKQEHKTGKLS